MTNPDQGPSGDSAGSTSPGPGTPPTSGRAPGRLSRADWLALALTVLLPPLLAAAFLYVHYSRLIDARLQGDHHLEETLRVFASAPQVRVGDARSREELIGYLRGIGYVDRRKTGDPSHGWYALGPEGLEVLPGPDTRVAGTRLFPHVRFSFVTRAASDGRAEVARITDLDGGTDLQSCRLEPPLLVSAEVLERRERRNVAYEDIPAVLRLAILSTEDRRFFDHPGIDPRGIARAAWHDLAPWRNGPTEGGSTITQQWVRTAFLARDRTIRRKLEELALALILEHKLTKREIFALYCNSAYLGQSGALAVRGFDQAARVYFGRPIERVTLPEAAYLAGIIHGPSQYSPRSAAGRARGLARRNEVLGLMAETGAITAAHAARARRALLVFRPRPAGYDRVTPYLVDYVQERLPAGFARDVLPDHGARVFTTIDAGLERVAYEALARQIARLESRLLGRRRGWTKSGAGPLQGALVALDARNGDVLALVGGRDYRESQFDRATEARRPPGSVFKPFLYAAAIERRVVTPATRFPDEPRSFTYDSGRKTYTPANYGGHYAHADQTVRKALAASSNVIAVAVAERTGYDRVAEEAARFGLPRPEAFPSIALGASGVVPLDLAAAYAPFANGGMWYEPRVIRALTTAEGGPVATPPPASRRAISPQVAYLLTDMMRDVLATGTGARVRASGFEADAAGKTGTARDGWFIGFTPGLVCAVWIGYDDGRDLKLTGAEAALPVWLEFTGRALVLRPDLGGSFAEPDGLETVNIDPENGLRASEWCPSPRRELFLPGTAPTDTCQVHRADPWNWLERIRDLFRKIAG